ncbi:hypothetical protein Fot_05557 [Forsythia ovata]|uniref:Uncharacterized protein n=1 Tax=Forsythia ovata TaxID=205694 RepID=A0ABD1WQI3_9LAMI
MAPTEGISSPVCGARLVPEAVIPFGSLKGRLDLGRTACLTGKTNPFYPSDDSKCELCILSPWCLEFYKKKVKVVNPRRTNGYTRRLFVTNSIQATSVEDYDPIDDAEQYEDFVDEYENVEPNLDNDDSEDGENDDHSDYDDVLENDAD